MDDRSDSEDAEEIEEVRSDRVSHRDVCVSLDGGDDRRDQFRQARPDRYDGESDHGGAHIERRCQPHAAVNERPAARSERSDSDG